MKIKLDGKNLSIKQIALLVDGPNGKIDLETKALKRVASAHKFLKQAVKENNKIIYGVNTGFGPMASYILAHDQLLALQENLIVSHAVGLGESVDDKFVLAAMVVRLNTLMRGYSAVSPQLLAHLKAFINLRITPVVPEHGAVGTSGDLVQLAHIALAILGKGQAKYKGRLEKVSSIFKKENLTPYKLNPKEGLALINGTSMMTGIAALVCDQAQDLLSLGIRAGCLSLEIVQAYKDGFSETLHGLRPHPGQVLVAGKMRKILNSSPLIRSRMSLAKHANQTKEVHKINEPVQEFYSLRCIAQILGPVYDTLTHTRSTVETEMNAVTDNPIVDWENNKLLHGGNFHGDYIAVAMDQLKMGLTKFTMLSERRLNFFLNHKINQIFPPFLNLDTPGLTLGLQALQFVATSTAAQNQTLSYPMNLHSIPTNGDNQDVVSMGTDAALMTDRVLQNAYVVQAIELLALCQAVDFLKIKNSLTKDSRMLYDFVRGHVKVIVEDREIEPEIQNFCAALKNFKQANLL